MFTSLMSFLANWWTVIKSVWLAIFDWFKVGYVWLIGIVVALIGFIQWVADTAGQLLGTLISTFTSITVPNGAVDTTSVTDALSTVNTFFPLNEGFAMLIALSVLWITMLIYRFVKSWIPTVS